MSHYIIQNPYHEYAVAFMRHILARFGYAPLCIFTDLKARHHLERRFPDLAKLAPDTRFDATRRELPQLAAALRERYKDIVGIVPFAEESLDDAPLLVEALGLDWNPPEVLARFRDKHAFKAFIARTRPGLRLNRHFPVKGPADLDAELPERFVLKPNDGAGSRGVGVFRRETPKAELVRFLSGFPGQTFILEEFVSGTLYTIDGLVDERGGIHVAAVFTSGRTSANGSDVVYAEGWLIHQNTALFRDLAGYAAEVMAASALRRCPFHMEVIVDERGPCLIEVAARLIGNRHAYTCQLAHRNRFDFFAASAHGYLSSQPYGELGFDWDYYNSIQMLKVYGVSSRSGILHRAGGVDAVERLPEFLSWGVKPEPGQKLEPTTDITNMPYAVLLLGTGTLAELRVVGETVHRLIELDLDGPLFPKLRRGFARAYRRARLYLGWRARQALFALRPTSWSRRLP